MVTASFTCSLQPTTQDLLVDSVAVVPAATTTAITVQNAPIQYGDTPNVTAEVTAPGKGKPDGTVAFTYAGKTVTVDVKGGKTKSTSLPAALTMGANSVSAVFTPTDKNLATTQTTQAFTVVKADSTTSVSAVYRTREGPDRGPRQGGVGVRDPRRRPGEVRAQARRGEDPHQDGPLNKFDVARGVFNNIRKSAAYTVVARYQGSATLKRSNDRFKFVV